MQWLAILPYVMQLVSYIPSIQKAWESSATGGIQAVTNVIQNTPVAGTLADIGAALFPKLDSTIHAAAAALVIVHPNNTSWIQSAINVLASTGYVSLPAPLTVDGLYGSKTHAAVIAVQTKLGLPVTGFVADAEYSAISKLIAEVGG